MISPNNHGFINGISEIVEYLNDNGYSISAAKTMRFIEMFNDDTMDFSNKRNVIGAMKTCFCTTPAEAALIEKFLDAFVSNRPMSMGEMIENKEKLKDNRSRIEQMNDRRIEIEKFKEEKRKQLMSSYQLNVKIKKDEITALKKLEKQGKKFAAQLVIGAENGDWAPFLDACPNQYTAEKEIADSIKECENKLFSGDAAGFKNEKVYHDVLERITSAAWGTGRTKEIDKIINKEYKEYAEELKKLNSDKKKLTEETKEIQKKIDDALKAMKDSEEVTRKLKSQNHRDVFQGRKPVQSTYDCDLEFLDTEFDDLSNNEKADIYRYIKDNALRLKTRMARQIKCENSHIINMQDTISHACRTGGIPMNISYEKPHANKTNIVLVLDISGSCREASEMMLTFMHILQSIYPRGCKAYAFVNSLYDISQIMTSTDSQEAIRKVLTTIPTRGIYSNYYIPLQSLWKDHHNDIDTDSIVIFIGDARNNKNDTGEEYLRNISRRAKKCYWVNTESKANWDFQDSLASTYGKYAKMYQATTVRQLLDFISII